MRYKMAVDKKIIEEMMLDEEEIKLLKEQEMGEWVESSDLEYSRNNAKIIAKNTIDNMRKNKSITIRINDVVLNRIKAKSLALGIPYQTLITGKINELAYY